TERDPVPGPETVPVGAARPTGPALGAPGAPGNEPRKRNGAAQGPPPFRLAERSFPHYTHPPGIPGEGAAFPAWPHPFTNRARKWLALPCTHTGCGCTHADLG